MMIRLRNSLIAASAVLAGVALFASCKGRTMENMEPTSDTVEVEIDVRQQSVPQLVHPEASAEVQPADSAEVPAEQAP